MSTDLHRCFKCNNPVDAVAKRWAPGYVCDRCIDQYAVVDPESAFELEPGTLGCPLLGLTLQDSEHLRTRLEVSRARRTIKRKSKPTILAAPTT